MGRRAGGKHRRVVRRGYGEGSISRYRGGWRVRVRIDGKSVAWKLATKAAAVAKLREALRDRDDGIAQTPAKALSAPGARTTRVGLPKSRASRRTLPLTASMLGILAGHHNAVKHERLQRRWRDDLDLVFPGEDGQHLGYSVVHRSILHPALSRARCPMVTMHDLRHSYASIALQNGADVHTVSRMLGHARVSITLDVYAHSVGSLAGLADHMDELLRPGTPRQRRGARRKAG